MRSSVFIAAAAAGYVAAQDPTSSVAEVVSSVADGAEPTGEQVASVSSFLSSNPAEASALLSSYASQNPAEASSYLEEFYSTADPSASSEMASAASGFFGPMTGASSGMPPAATSGNGTGLAGVSSAVSNANGSAYSSWVSSFTSDGSTVSSTSSHRSKAYTNDTPARCCGHLFCSRGW